MTSDQIPAAIEPLMALLKSLMGYAELALGGIFGIYLILVVLRWYETFKLVRLIKAMTNQLELISDRIGVKKKILVQRTVKPKIKKSRLQRIQKKIIKVRKT